MKKNNMLARHEAAIADKLKAEYDAKLQIALQMGLDAAFKAAKAEGFKLKDNEVQHLDFWDKGIKFFNIEGPNSETIEFCEIVK